MSAIQWWCAARPEPWSWRWQPFPGVWLVVATIATVLALVQRTGPLPTWRRALSWAAVLGIWATLDWPAGPLGAGYLAAVHAGQFLMLAMIVPLPLLLGVPDAAWARLEAARTRGALASRVAAAITRPAVAALLLAGVMVLTHLPPVTDTLMATPRGAFTIDMSWLLSGLCFAWPLVVPVPARPSFTTLPRIAYLFAGTVAHVFIGMWFLVAEYPLYATYELAPPFPTLTPRADQQVAGAVMLLIGTPLVIAAVSVLFFKQMGRDAGE